MSVSTEQQLDILLRLGKAIAKEKDIDRLLHITGDFARDILDASVGAPVAVIPHSFLRE